MELRKFGVDTAYISCGGARIGICFLEKGASQRGIRCIYDRADSFIQTADRTDFDWDKIFEDAERFHFTDITPALSKSTAEICLDACKAVKEKNVKVSCDLNYRCKMWGGAEARETMSKLCKYVDICIANEEDSKDVFGMESEDTNAQSGKLNKEGYREVAEKLTDEFGFEAVAFTLRTSISANDNDWAGMLYTSGTNYYSRECHLRIVDRVGGGDSFGAGLIFSLINGKSPQEAIYFAVAASSLKHSIEGDFNRVSVAEVKKLAGGNGTGRVQR